jgi:hypothetical protein
MFERITDWLLAMLDSIPILLGADPHNAHLVRAMAALLLIALFVYFMAMRPFGGIIRRLFRRSTDKQK